MKPVRSSERVEGGSEIEARIGDQRPDRCRGLVRIALHGQVALEHRRGLVGEAGAVCGAGEKALGDLAGAASADPRDSGNRQDVLHESLGGLRGLALDRRKKAGMFGQALTVTSRRGRRAPGRRRWRG